MNKTGLLITFEGIDGCGKTTQLAKAREWLEKRGYRCVVTREPGGTPVSEKIRSLLLSNESGEMCNEAEVLLYLAARAQHVREKILPQMASGAIVLCDRFQEATFAYQGYGRGHSLETLQRMNAFATGGLDPMHTFVFDLPVDTALERMRAMNKTADRLERSPRDFYERTREGYRQLAACCAGRGRRRGRWISQRKC